MAAKSKKGGKFERETCQLLSVWFSGGDIDADWFWRTAGSGGRSTQRKKKGKSADKGAGDICATDPKGEPLMKVFAMELKRGYQKDTIQDLLDASDRAAPQTYEKWIAQAEASRQNSGALYWMVICKRDQRKAMVMFPPCFLTALMHVGHSWRGAGDKLKFESNDHGGVMLATLDDFLEHVTPEAVHAVLENIRDVPTLAN